MTNREKNQVTRTSKEKCQRWNKVAIQYGNFKNTKLFYEDNWFSDMLINETNFMY